MYEELIEALRLCVKYGKAEDALANASQAADAIEKLGDWWAMADKLIKMLEMPRWISVTERLPEKNGEFLVCGRWRGKPIKIWVCERVKLGLIMGWANPAENPVISHWIPLPEPPKEETE